MTTGQLLTCGCVYYSNEYVDTLHVQPGCDEHDIECAWCSSHTDRGTCADSPDHRHEMVQRGA